MEGEGDNKWKFIKTVILKRFTDNENIFLLENPQILGCRFLNELVLIHGFLLY